PPSTTLFRSPPGLVRSGRRRGSRASPRPMSRCSWSTCTLVEGGRSPRRSAPMSDVPVSGAAFRETFLQALDQVLAAPLFAPLLPLVTNDKRERILKFITRLVEANRSLNLTAITDPAAIAAKHVGDSLTCLLVGDWPEGTSVCDVGTGGGFPGMLLAIVRPDLDVCLVDSVGKKV